MMKILEPFFKLIAITGVVDYAYEMHPPLLSLLGYSFLISILTGLAIWELRIFHRRKAR